MIECPFCRYRRQREDKAKVAKMMEILDLCMKMIRPAAGAQQVMIPIEVTRG